MITVEVLSPKRRLLYVDQVYKKKNPPKIPAQMVLEAGPHRFETINSDGLIDYRADISGSPDSAHFEIRLQRLDPPEQKP